MTRKMLFGYNFGKLSIAIIPAVQAKAEKQDWVEIEPASLDETAFAAYRDYKAQYAKAKAARELFEQAMRDAAGIATAPAPKPAGAARQSLADYLASRR